MSKKSKLTGVEKIILMVVVVFLIITTMGFYQLRKSIKSGEFQKEATEFRDWIKG